ncbi:MAG: hypothetical protein ACREYF_11695 [Gammaproteobacteria bacterium]
MATKSLFLAPNFTVSNWSVNGAAFAGAARLAGVRMEITRGQDHPLGFDTLTVAHTEADTAWHQPETYRRSHHEVY